ncbi:MAG: type II secretion system protein GspL, partial [Myxococcota bacterium]
RFEEQKFSPGANAEDRAATLREFVTGYQLSQDYVVAALPPDLGTQRHLQFPFSDPKKIAQALPFEIEEALPVPLDDLMLAHERVRTENGDAEVLAFLAPRSQIGSHLEWLRGIGSEPRVLELEGTVLANLAGFLALDEKHRFLVDIGHRKTTVCLLAEGRPALHRSIPVAGADFTAALARDLELAPDEAEERKHEEGLFGESGTEPVGPSLTSQLDRLASDLLRLVQSAGSPAEEVLLMGGSSQATGLDDYLSTKLGLPCRVLAVPPGEEGRSLLSTVGPARFAQATALALRGASRSRVTKIDFRRDEFRYKPDLSDLRRGLRLPAVLAVALLLVWMGGLGARILANARQASTYQQQLAEVYQQSYPDAPPTDRPLAAIQERVRKTRQVADHLGVTGGGVSPLQILRHISQGVPEGAGTMLSELQIERSSIRARGSAPTFEAADQLRTELARLAAFERVNISDVATDKAGGKAFSLSIRLQGSP